MPYHTAEVHIPEVNDYIEVEIEFRIYEVGEPFADDVEWEYSKDRPPHEVKAIEKHIQDNFHKIMHDIYRQMKDI